MTLGRTLRTVRHLRPRQLSDRIARRWRRLPAEPAAASAYRLDCSRPPQPKIQTPATIARRGSFTFLDQTLPFAGDDRWLPRAAPALWRYQLHYFQYLPQLGTDAAGELIEDWLKSNPPGSPVAWDPYPISLRLREWIEWLVGHPELDDGLRRRVIASLVHQTAALESRLEYHLMANHLLENAIGLCWAGIRLDGPLTERWRRMGRRLLERELAEQVLPDGTHYERSPMYQASIAESLLRLAAVAAGVAEPVGRAIGRAAGAAGERLLGGLDRLCHPDGDYALLNDCALGQAPLPGVLRERFGLAERDRHAPGIWLLEAAGFAGWDSGRGSYLIVDAGDLRPPYNPGHAHAAMLSFELSHRGRRIVTDTGVGTYEEGAARLHSRGTAAHNTVQVDGRDQSEVWGAFRCGRRARMVELAAESSDAGGVLRAAYRGSLAGRVDAVHRRSIAIGEPQLRFTDRVAARGEHTAVLRLHLAPELGLSVRGSQAAVSDESGRPLARLELGDGAWQKGTSPYHPRFGVTRERVQLEAHLAFREDLSIEWAIDLL